MKVIIADDEEIVRRILKTYLAKFDFLDILEASSEAEINTLMQIEKPDLIMLDLSFEKKNDGLEILKKIKLRTPYVKVVVISGDIHLNTVRKALSLQADAYIKKPFSEKQIEKMIFKLGSISINSTFY